MFVLDFFKNLFKFKVDVVTPGISLDALPDNNDIELQSYFIDELKKSVHIKPESHQQVLDHLMDRVSITKTNNKLSVQEKRILGINTRLSITRELISVLSDEGVKLDNPKSILTEIYYRAYFRKLRQESLSRLSKSTVVKKVKLMSCGNGNDCLWCKENQNIEYNVTDRVDTLIENNCTCVPYCMCGIDPVISFD